jgi:hypothetical protein
VNSCTPTSTTTSLFTRALIAPTSAFAHLREIEAIEVVEVDRIVAVNIAERLIDHD